MQKIESHSQFIEVDGQEYHVVHDDFEIEGDIEETDEALEFDVVLAREMVQPYRKNGRKIDVLKEGDELQRAAEFAEAIHVTDGHPETGVVKRQTQSNGFVKNIGFDEDIQGIKGRARVMKDRADDQFIQEILDEERTDVSIGFYAQYDQTSGDLDGQEYDAVQRNIVLDHLAIAPPEKDGRCSSEDGCGIVQHMADTLQNDQDDWDVAVNEPEDPQDVADDLREAGYDVELRECNCGDHKGHITITGEPENEGDIIFPTHEGLPGFSAMESESWDRPNFSDFGMEEDQFTSIDEGAKRFVAAHFGAVDADSLSEATYTDLKFPHHSPESQDVDRAGVIAGRQRLPQADMPQEALEQIDTHLTNHLREDFDEEDVETIFDWEEVEDGSEPVIRDRYLNQDGELVNKENTIGDQNMSNNDDDTFEDVTDLDMDDLRGHPEVRDLEDRVQSLEDQIEALEDTVEVSEDEDLESVVEDLKEAKEELDQVRENQVEDLREELQEDYGLDEEKVEDKGLDELETMKDTLEEADVGQEGDVTSTQTGSDTGSDQNLIAPQSGPHADQYEEA